MTVDASMNVAGAVPSWEPSDYLRKAREYAGLSQSDLAERTGISRRTISRNETGPVTLRRPQMIAWAMATGVSLAWLMNGENPRPGDPDGGERLPRLDLNQRPSGYTSSLVNRHSRTRVGGLHSVRTGAAA